MGGRVAGICYFKIQGKQLEVQGNVECPLLPTTKEKITSSSGTFFKESKRAHFIKGTFIFTKDFPLELLERDDLAITFESPTGRAYNLTEAWTEGDPTAKSDDGTTELEFTGKQGGWV